MKNYNILQRKYSKTGFCVHHIDCNSENDDPSNLLVCTPGEHWELHFQLYLDALRAGDEEGQRRHGRACNCINNQNRLGNPSISGFKSTDATKEKISATQMGKKHSEETLAKMSAAHTGKKHSEETLAKLSAARKGTQTGAKNHKSVKVMNTDSGEIYDSIKQAAYDYGLNRSTLVNYLNGNRVNKTNLIKLTPIEYEQN